MTGLMDFLLVVPLSIQEMVFSVVLEIYCCLFARLLLYDLGAATVELQNGLSASFFFPPLLWSVFCLPLGVLEQRCSARGIIK